MRSRRTVLKVGLAVLAFLLAAVAEGETVTVQVDAEPSGTTTAAGFGTADVIVSYGGEPGQTEKRTVKIPGQVEVDLLPGVSARISVAAEGWWANAKVVHVDGPRDVRLLLRPAGWITGKLQVPEGEELPDQLQVKLLKTAQITDDQEGREASPPSPDGYGQCPVKADSFRCQVPSGRLDLRLRAKGFVSHHRWALDVDAQEVVPVGNLDLYPGASIVGWIEAPVKDFSMDDIRVRVRPLAAGAASTSLDRKRADALRRESRVNPMGFFEVPSVAPGSYEVIVEHEDFATARISPVNVLERAETEIHQIRLEPAVEFEVILSPPTHPFGGAWHVELLQEAEIPGALDVVAEGVAGRDGGWSTGELVPGRYTLRVGDGRGARWAIRQVTLGDWNLPVEVELPIDRLEGTVKLAGEPVAATLYFGGRHGAIRNRVRSDDEGKFYVFLPRKEDPWVADVVAPELGIDVQVRNIEVRKLPGEPWAKTEIDLPDTRIIGTVLDESRNLLPGAVVEIVGTDGDYLATTNSDGEGTFEISGLQPGSVSVQARYARSGRRLSSERVAVELGDREEAQPVRLTLLEDSSLEGQILAPQGQGVPGARVMARLHDPHGTLLSVMPSSTTDVDGVFNLRLPRGAEQIVLSVLAPGYAVRSLPVQVQRGQPLMVELAPTGGTLVISYEGEDQVSPALLRHRTSLFQPHLVAQSGALRQWAQLHGVTQDDPDRFVIPMLEPVPYTACYKAGFRVLSAGWLPVGGLSDRCASGVLAPHGRLNLTVPVPDSD